MGALLVFGDFMAGDTSPHRGGGLDSLGHRGNGKNDKTLGLGVIMRFSFSYRSLLSSESVLGYLCFSNNVEATKDLFFDVSHTFLYTYLGGFFKFATLIIDALSEFLPNFLFY